MGPVARPAFQRRIPYKGTMIRRFALARAAVGALIALSLGVFAPSISQADAGELNLRLEGAAGLPVAGHLAPRGTVDQHAQWGINFWLGLDYTVSAPVAIDLLLGVGRLFETDDRMRLPGATGSGYESNRGNAIGQVAIGPKLRFDQLWLSGHIGLYVFDGVQFGGDVGVGYDFAVSESFDLGLFARVQATAEGDGAGRFVTEEDDRTDAALWLGIAGQFAVIPAGKPAADTDGDGVSDNVDECVNEAEDRDGFEDDDGCPDLDNDGDGIPDDRDAAPNEAEDVDGFEDEDGAPDLDNDGDGIPDDRDAAPNEAEDVDGFEDEDGAPDLDNDGDSIPDTEDRCPNEAGVASESGCPEPDRDGDGVPDYLDNCPDVVGTAENQGCVERQRVEIRRDQLVISETVDFRSNRHHIDRRSFELLDNVAAVILAHPEVGMIRVEGHTEGLGRREANLRLSQRRADEVRLYLVSKGVPAERLTAVGLGPDRPLVPGATAAED
ncbi:MAG: OmpA family protein, partial [Dietzia sp.]|nr:OmpA family protein [Dietzia sp.]